MPHFNKYPLQTRKVYDYILFKQIVEALERKEHHTAEGCASIIERAFKMNPHGKNRKYQLEDILNDLKESSETIRQTEAHKVLYARMI